ncbi:hypothetical protein Neosp_002899 [[Neocosmospora] mangrovei]
MSHPQKLVPKAYVVAERGGPFELRDVVLDGLQPNEVLVEIEYTGLCHTDLVVQQGGMPIGGYPVVLGHEGLGTVRDVGSSVSCRGCLGGRYGSCSQMTETNFINPGRKGPGATSPISLPDGTPVFGQFFGQSSLSKMAVVCENSVVKISAKPQDLAFLAPLACGYLTGAGTVLNVLQPRNDSKVAVLGMGAVGLAAMLAAKAVGVEYIVAVDLVDEKLQLAKSLGATHIIDTSTGLDLNTAIREKFPNGVDYIVDTTGVAKLLQASVQALSHEGTLALVGVPPPTAQIQVNALDLLLSCKRIVGVIEGFSNPQKLIPELLELYYSGKFPIDRISKCYPAEDLDKAIQDLKEGRERNSKGWWSNSYVQELKSRVRELEDTQRLAGTINVHIPPSECELGDPIVLPEDSPAVVLAVQDDSDNQNNTPSERPQLDTNQIVPVPTENLPDKTGALGAYHLGIPSPLESTAAAPIDGASEQASVPWLDLSFGQLSAFVSPPKDRPQKEIDKPGAVDTGAGEPAMNAMGVVVFIHSTAPRSSKHPSDYFGPSSTISLLREARSVMGRQNSGHAPWLLDNLDRGSTGRDDTAISTSEPSPMSSIWFNYGSEKFHPMLGMNVPPRAEADRLVNLFWTYVHSLYPFLHWPSFYDRYLTLWSPQTSSQADRTTCSMNGYYTSLSESLFHCMLNVVFALGVLHNTELSQQERDDISYTFFRRSKSLLSLDLLESGSTPLVQVLLLMGQYLQTRDITSSCWNIIGMAIRVAQGIGLHLQPEERDEGDTSNYQAADQLEEEMRRRAWTGCVLLDRILSLTYGRPLMIHSGDAHSRLLLPSSIDDELLTRSPHSPGAQPMDIPSRVECYIHAIKLQDILGQVLTSFYHQGSENEKLLEQEASSYNSGMQKPFTHTSDYHNDGVDQESRMIEESLSSSEGYRPAVYSDSEHNVIAGKDAPSTFNLGLDEENNNWVNTDGLDWFSLAPFFGGTADIAP